MGQKEVASIAACCGVSVAAATYYLLSRPKKTTSTIPTTMRRLVVTQTADELEKVSIQVQETPVPTLGFGKVLIKMEAVPLVGFFVLRPFVALAQMATKIDSHCNHSSLLDLFLSCRNRE